MLSALQRDRVLDLEARYGREGVWCSCCRRSTPVEQVVLHEDRSVVSCETCRAELVVLTREAVLLSWLEPLLG